jgi:hypothetical protein
MMKTCPSCPTPAKCKKAGKCLKGNYAKGGMGKLKAPSIMIAVAMPKVGKASIPKAPKVKKPK